MRVFQIHRIIKYSSKYSGYNYYEKILLGASNQILRRSEKTVLKEIPLDIGLPASHLNSY